MSSLVRNIALAFGAAVILSACSPDSVRQASAPSPNGSPLVFRDVAKEVGIDFALGHGGRSPLTILDIIGHGGAFLDFDADGLLDVLLLGPDSVRLFRNRGKQFEEVTKGSNLPGRGYWIAAASGDFDNDGWPDLYLSGYRCRELLRNEGGKRFRPVAVEAGLPAENAWGTSAAFADLDQDGWLDLFVCHYLQFGPESKQICVEGGHQLTCGPSIYPPAKPRFYRNLGKGRFSDATEAFGFADSKGRGLAVLPADLNDDGKTDLIVANDTEPADHFRNLGGGRFENVAHEAGTALADNGKALGGMALDAQDYDRDGRQDLALSSFETEPKCLWRNVGEGQFVDESTAAGLDVLRPYVAWGMGLVDFDNDGWLDMLSANGHVVVGRVDPNHSYPQPLKLFRGESGTFKDVTAQLNPKLQTPFVGRGVAFGDFDNDGRVDALVCNLEGPALLLKNEAPRPGHWLAVQLEGSRSNRQGLGARIEARAGAERWIAEARTGRSTYTASDPRVHFGLGEVIRIERLTVRWPSGTTTELKDVATDQLVRIKEQPVSQHAPERDPSPQTLKTK